MSDAPERIWATTAREGFDTIHSEWPPDVWPPEDHPYDYPVTEYVRADLSVAEAARVLLAARNEAKQVPVGAYRTPQQVALMKFKETALRALAKEADNE